MTGGHGDKRRPGFTRKFVTGLAQLRCTRPSCPTRPRHHPDSEVTCNFSIVQSSTMASRSLLSSLWALSLASRPVAAKKALFHVQQPARPISQAILPALRAAARPTAVATAAGKAPSQQQTRGMKVHSSVKRRCEHCKVGGGGGGGGFSLGLHVRSERTDRPWAPRPCRAR
jgi:large subunit ribosomal protein L36